VLGHVDVMNNGSSNGRMPPPPELKIPQDNVRECHPCDRVILCAALHRLLAPWRSSKRSHELTRCSRAI
jgi:hypothetical protein